MAEIIRNWGFFGHYQKLVADQLDVPVYDAITLIKYVKSTVTQMPYYGFL